MMYCFCGKAILTIDTNKHIKRPFSQKEYQTCDWYAQWPLNATRQF